MSLYEFIPFIVLVSIFLFGFLYCLFLEIIRKRMIVHMEKFVEILSSVKDK